MQNLNSAIESVLFVANKPLTTKAITKLVYTEDAQVTEAQVLQALQEIAEARRQTGIILLEATGSWQLATNPENSEAVKTVLNAELREKLTDATIETLAIIAYRQPIARGEIEAIRGVNCQYSIRHLLIRGLIQRSTTKDSRQVLYETTIEFLQHMGIGSVSELPEFEQLVEKIKLPETPTILEPEVEVQPDPSDPVMEEEKPPVILENLISHTEIPEETDHTESLENLKEQENE
jgi:segregation and condensation protein B